MSRRIIVCLLAGALVATTALAREDTGSKDKPKRSGARGGWGFFGPYGGMFDFKALNDELQKPEFGFTEEFDPKLFMFGGGGMALADNVTIGGYGFGGHQTIHSDPLHLNLSAEYGGGMFEVGWMPVATRHFIVGPALGIGGSGFTLKSASARGFEPRFDSLLVKGTQTWEITNSSFVLAPALNVMIPISWAGIYLKAGYFLNLFDKEWKAGSTVLSTRPDLRSSGPFASFQVMLGGGGSKAKVKVKTRAEPEKPCEPDEPDEPDEDSEEDE